MRLEDELKATGCDLAPDAFCDMLGDLYTAMYRATTPDSFLCRPWEHRAYCAVVRSRAGLCESADDLILRTLLNMRKRGLFKSAGPPAKLNLKAELAQFDPQLSPDGFRAVVEELFLDIYKAFTVDQLLMRWRDAVHFCAVVRTVSGIPACRAADELVLRTLLNNRRKGRLSLRDRNAA